MKIENLISIYKIPAHKTTVADIKAGLPGIEDMEAAEAAVEVRKFVIANETSLMDDERCEAELAKISKCRICGKAGELITVMRNRPAFFCKAHNIVNPVPMELIKKYNFDYTSTK